MLPMIIVEDIIKIALKEDLNYIDKATDILVNKNDVSIAKIVAKQDGVISGVDVAIRVFEILDPKIKTNKIFEDGDEVKKGQIVLKIEGRTETILKGERVALNLMGRMSGISTKTNEYVQIVNGMDIKIADTRKTTPGLRILEKYSVLIGGGENHRFNLSDGAMIKDNHIDASGSITNAVKKIREKVGFMTKIEVETRNLDEVQEAINSGADIIMLDNMDTNMMSEAVRLINKRAIVEGSGNVDKQTLLKIAQTGVDVISVGGLTHSVNIFDFSLKIEK